jgi:carbamoyl-phosphate synthase/aspartate carbamoyltransferase
MSSNIPVPHVTTSGTAPISVIAAHITAPAANATPISFSPRSPTEPKRPAAALEDPKDVTTAALVLKDGTSFQGISFGAETQSISGECVFQTGMFVFIY